MLHIHILHAMGAIAWQILHCCEHMQLHACVCGQAADDQNVDCCPAVNVSVPDEVDAKLTKSILDANGMGSSASMVSEIFAVSQPEGISMARRLSTPMLLIQLRFRCWRCDCMCKVMELGSRQ